jgi:hypothetical protein
MSETLPPFPQHALMPQCLIIPELYLFLAYKSTQLRFENFARFSLFDGLCSCLQNTV